MNDSALLLADIIASTGISMGKKAHDHLDVAIFAGGCFWCMEAAFEGIDGVREAISGYIGGTKENPTYEEVSSGTTGHYEAVEIFYDPTKVTYAELLDFFFRQIDPTDSGGQFTDKGSQYKTAVFYKNDSEKELAGKAKKKVEDSKIFDKPIVTEILPFDKFYKAEEYHQNFYKKRIGHYEAYVQGSGRKEKLKQIWEE